MSIDNTLEKKLLSDFINKDKMLQWKEKFISSQSILNY